MTDLEKSIANVPKVYEAGREKQWSDFWDAYQQNGKRATYPNAFSSEGWNATTFRPKYDFVNITASNSMFVNFAWDKTEPVDLVALLDECGVTLSTSNVTNGREMFYGANVSHIPTIDMTKWSNYTNVFERCQNLVTIDKVIAVYSKGFINTFKECNSLQNLTFEGTIYQSISFQWSPLTVESAKSIITHLVDYSETENEYVYTVNFSDTTKALLEAEGTTAPNGTTWLNYIGTLGWTI